MMTRSGLVYVECDVPADMTLAEWRRARAHAGASRWVRIARRSLRLRAAA